MSQILRPRFERLCRLAQLFAERGKCVSKAVRIEIRRVLSTVKACLKISRIGVAVLQCLRSNPATMKAWFKPIDTFVRGNSGSSLPQRRSLLEENDPVGHNLLYIVTDREKKKGCKSFAEFRLHVARILMHAS